MADPVTFPPFTTALFQTLADSAPASQPDPTGLASATVPASLEASAEAANPQLSGNDAIASELLNLDAPSLALLNEVGNDPDLIPVAGNLTPEQLQAVNILQQDAQNLEDSFNLTSPVPLTQEASTIDLSPEAQAIADNDTNNEPPALTPQQLPQIQQILQSYLNQPLTPQLVTQLQAQLTANQLSGVGLSLNTLILSYIAALQPNTMATKATTDAKTEPRMPIAPVAAIDEVAVEDGTILA